VTAAETAMNVLLDGSPFRHLRDKIAIVRVDCVSLASATHLVALQPPSTGYLSQTPFSAVFDLTVERRISGYRGYSSGLDLGVRRSCPADPAPSRCASRAFAGRIRWTRAQWDGPMLVLHLRKYFGVRIKFRQAQSWLHHLGYRLKRVGYHYVQARAEDARRFRESLNG
jgi:hypothetical protein